MMNDFKMFHAAKRLVWLSIALGFTSCSTPPPPELTPAGNSDVDLMMARFAKAVHVIADLNEDGDVTFQELLRVDADADDERFRLTDLNKSGGLSLEEATTATTNGAAGAKLRRKFDPDNDGAINASDAARFDRMIEATDGLRKFVEVEHILSL
jgi:hypothetical protein